MRIPEIDYARYAHLLVHAGVQLRPGQNLRIRHDVSGSILARHCAQVAYAAGARIVEVEFRDEHAVKARIQNQAGDLDALGAVPGWTHAWEESILTESWSYLAIASFDYTGLFSDVNPEAVASFERLQTEKRSRYRDAMMRHGFPWTVCGVPGDGWAQRVLGPGASAEDLWEKLKPILLLDTDNPTAAWSQKVAHLKQRRDSLDAMNLKALHFQDTGTDLTIGLLPTSIWCGGGSEDCGGMPNIPTEEVFTTPDYRQCNGTVRVVRPVEVWGTILKGVELTFDAGCVVEFHAAEGKDVLEAFLETDPGSRRLGEVALVGEDSAIAASQLVFHSVLYDENASCHIALGSGYPTCLSNGGELTNPAKKEGAGCNHSLVHKDFMIGTPNTAVTGIDRGGCTIPIIQNGLFVI